jgi:hypothetical protein
VNRTTGGTIFESVLEIDLPLTRRVSPGSRWVHEGQLQEEAEEESVARRLNGGPACHYSSRQDQNNDVGSPGNEPNLSDLRI